MFYDAPPSTALLSRVTPLTMQREHAEDPEAVLVSENIQEER